MLGNLKPNVQALAEVHKRIDILQASKAEDSAQYISNSI